MTETLEVMGSRKAFIIFGGPWHVELSESCTYAVTLCLTAFVFLYKSSIRTVILEYGTTLKLWTLKPFWVLSF